MEQLKDFLSELKNGEKFREFISKCLLILPNDTLKLYENYKEIFEKFANQVSTYISQDPHMLPISPEEIISTFLERKSNFFN